MSDREAEQIIPNCRYGHGDLVLVANAENDKWGFINVARPQGGFIGKLYLCSRCGYTEFFDDEPQVTATVYGAK